ncbi:MAG TPA: hypothetical protein VKV95_12355 [Terriglobia bacterium]|nr:hypothetical protein [Terriglobia bacterium]
MPTSLREEFELFRMMDKATRCYDLNTTLQRNHKVQGERDAVGRTMAIIARTLAGEPRDISVTIENCSDYIR